MALDPQSLADPSPPGGRPLTPRPFAAVALAVGLGVSLGAVDLSAYRAAAGSGRVSAIEGRAYAERRLPKEADRPLPAVSVVFVPLSPTFLARLELIKAHARESERDFVDAASALRREREAYEKGVWEAGFPDLVVATASDVGGRFTVAALPAGDWLLLATRSVLIERTGSRVSPRDRSTFVPRLRLAGYYAVSVWLRKLSIEAGRREKIDLTDRNVWFTGVVEDRSLDLDH